jgi:hypothetical protein
VTRWQPDADYRQRQGEAQMIESKCPGWAVLYGAYTRAFWAFGAPDGHPVTARTASELLGRMRAAERLREGPHYENGPPGRPFSGRTERPRSENSN